MHTAIGIATKNKQKTASSFIIVPFDVIWKCAASAFYAIIINIIIRSNLMRNFGATAFVDVKWIGYTRYTYGRIARCAFVCWYSQCTLSTSAFLQTKQYEGPRTELPHALHICNIAYISAGWYAIIFIYIYDMYVYYTIFSYRFAFSISISLLHSLSHSLSLYCFVQKRGQPNRLNYLLLPQSPIRTHTHTTSLHTSTRDKKLDPS